MLKWEPQSRRIIELTLSVSLSLFLPRKRHGEFHDVYDGDGIPSVGFLDDLNAPIPVHHRLRRLGRQVESIFAEIHSRVEQEADARKGEGEGGEGGRTSDSRESRSRRD